MKKTKEFWLSLFLINKSINFLKDTCQTAEETLDATERFKLPKIQDEIIYFFVFALSYWIQKSPGSLDDEEHLFEQALSDHLGNIMDMDTLYQRMIDYGQVINKKASETATFLDLGTKLGDYCGSDNVIFLTLAPELYAKALEFMIRLDKVQKQIDSNGDYSSVAELDKIWSEPSVLPWEK